jgi:hypothetical protein
MDENNDNEEEVDQYFDDAGDIGYLPADHVFFLFSLTFPISPSWPDSKML